MDGKKSDEWLDPGVHVEEVSSGVRPLEAVGTAVAAFVGFARLKPVRAAAAALVVAAVVWAVVGRRR